MLGRALLATALAAGLALGFGAAAPAAPRCFGAAARDPQHPCFNPSRSFTPGVTHLDDNPFSPCELTKEQPDPVCTFGVPAARATATVALIGDSHALHWRPAVDVVARRNHWRAYSITASGCFFSDAVKLMGVGASEICIPWYASAQRWFDDHPEVSTVFVSQNATTPVLVEPTQTLLGVKSAGFRRAWSGLPKTVRNVVVLRDTPDPRDDVFECVERVRLAGSGRPGTACVTPRADAMHQDYAATTVGLLHAARYRTIDMTSFFCGARDCYPVIGGSLVYRDIFGHVNQRFMTSLGPYLARKVRALRLR